MHIFQISAVLLMSLAASGVDAAAEDSARWFLTTLNGVPVTRVREERSMTEVNGRPVLVTKITETTRMRVRTRSYHVESVTERREWADTLEALSLIEQRNENGRNSTIHVIVNGNQYSIEIAGVQKIIYPGEVPIEGLYFRLDGEVLKKRGQLKSGGAMTAYVIVPEEGSMAHLTVRVKEPKGGGYVIAVENVSAQSTGWEEECSAQGLTEVVRVGGVTKRRVEEAEARLPSATPSVSNALEVLGRPRELYKRRTVYLKLTLPDSNSGNIMPESMYSKLLSIEGDTAYLALSSTYVDGTLPSAPLKDEERTQYLAHGRLFELYSPVIERSLKQALEETKGNSELAQVAAVVRWSGKRLQGGRTMPAMASAVEAITNRGGDCTEYAAVVVALLRKAGIPTRMALGLVFDGKGFQFHAWAEAYMEGCWIPADASYQRVGFPPAYIMLGYYDGGMGDYETRAMNLISGAAMEFLDGNPLETGR